MRIKRSNLSIELNNAKEDYGKLYAYANTIQLLKIFTVFIILLSIFSCQSVKHAEKNTINKKLIIYQLLPRLFGNKDTTNIPFGTIAQNGSGKFNDITEKALDGLKELQINYVWYTGVIAHASLTDYSKYGLPANDADVVKGMAGSPYAIRDYYDVDPDLAVNVENRMQEFENLIQRTHDKNMKVIIDFVPNHVARGYVSNAKPKNVIDFGENDRTDSVFSLKNDFYYIPGKQFIVPKNTNKSNPISKLQDGKYQENPAKATGNDVFNEAPNVNDWYETVKLNYGLDYKDQSKHFSPIPPVWGKMKDILIYWSKKGVDGFRCDVAEMVPVEFWAWVIPQVKKTNPNLIFIGEAYNTKLYEQFINQGKFDYLYDKVGLYDELKKLIKNDTSARTAAIEKVLKDQGEELDVHMLRFLENHDEERIGSKDFAKDPAFALPAMVVTATLGKGPVMIYFGQEVGEPANGTEGFGGEDNRTTIFDYWGVPNHQKWMNEGEFDGKKLNTEQKKLRAFYQKLLTITAQSDAINQGKTHQLPEITKLNNRIYAFIRESDTQRLLIVANFDRTKSFDNNISIPTEMIKNKPIGKLNNLLNGLKVTTQNQTGIKVSIPPNSAIITAF